MAGWVYIVTNKAMPGIVKVGYTERHPNERVREFNRTGVPYGYVVEYAIQVAEPYQLEQDAHCTLSSCRAGKEWFKCTVAHATSVIQMHARLLLREIIKGQEVQGRMPPPPVPAPRPPSPAGARPTAVQPKKASQTAVETLRNPREPEKDPVQTALEILGKPRMSRDGYQEAGRDIQRTSPIAVSSDQWSNYSIIFSCGVLCGVLLTLYLIFWA